MTPEVRIRYLEIQDNIIKAREKLSKAREMKDVEWIRDAESKLDYNYGAMSELTRWFGHFDQQN